MVFNLVLILICMRVLLCYINLGVNMFNMFTKDESKSEMFVEHS